MNTARYYLHQPGQRPLYVFADAPDSRPGWIASTVEECESIAANVAPDDMVPDTVSPWQMRRALNQLKLRDSVEAAVAAADQDTKDGWDYALEIRRDNPLINGMASGLGMTAAQLDELFLLAASFS